MQPTDVSFSVHEKVGCSSLKAGWFVCLQTMVWYLFTWWTSPLT